ncbi:unnamed protein product [Cuscuta europaea]|uniref:Uncharacterized protein n=1 Tax=Cuscuta europaea TaxID=41803 RepID=A0A9P0ZEP0_CUSEU|nr:unnamed protein product [Cuscuta europaea]
MASVHQFRLVSSLSSIYSELYPTKHPLNRPLKFQTLPISASLKSSSPNSEEEPPQSEKNNAVKLAFAKAKAYKKDVKTSPVPKIIQALFPESEELEDRGGGLKEDDKLSEEKEMPSAVKLAFAKAKAYKKDVKTSPVPKIIQAPVPESEELENRGGGLKEDDKLSEEKEMPSAVKLAFAKARAYKKDVKTTPVPKIIQAPVPESEELENRGLKENDKLSAEEEMPPAVKLAFQRANEYKKNKEEALGKFAGSQGSGVNEKGIVMDIGNGLPNRKEGKKEEVRVSSTDFMGLNFSDKKEGRRVPAGLLPISDPFPDGNFPEAEILVGDASKFGKVSKPEPAQEDRMDVYKPKVSTWGVFPRPTNISKTFGGGRTLKPGEELETAEVKAAKDARTRQLLVAYKSKMGMIVDPRLEFECEKVDGRWEAERSNAILYKSNG